MQLSDYLKPELVLFLKGKTKNSCIRELIEALVAVDGSLQAERLTEAVLHRESLMSTGIGLGIGVPHVRIEDVSHPYVAVGVHKEGLKDYESLDGRPVQIVVLIIAGKSQHQLYIKLLASVTSLLKREEIRQRIINAESPQEVYRIMTESDDR